MNHSRHQICKKEQLNNTQKNRIIKVKIALQNQEKILRSINDLNKFEEKVISKNETLAENTCYDWYDSLINYIPESLKKSVGFTKDKNMSFFKIKATKIWWRKETKGTKNTKTI